MPNAPTVNKPLSWLFDRIDKCELVLPEIQREFVWTKQLRTFRVLDTDAETQ